MPITINGDGTITGLAEGGLEDAKIINADIKDDTISEAKLDIHADPSGTDKYLAYTSNGMEWATVSGGAALANDANNRVTTADGSGGINGEANLTFDGTNLTIGGTGKLILGNGAGVDFSATADADAGGETISNVDEVLDDYEEGRWTPTLMYSGAGNCTTNSYSPKGRYVKVGQLVFVSGYIALTAKGSNNGGGYLEIHGLPFASDQYAQPDRPAYSGVSAYWGNFSSVKNLGIVWGNNNDKAYICGGDGDSAILLYGSLTDTSWLAFSMTYRASA
tara:strand:- start:535 stop:1365 length:831 start_codon:yes stop_codon:yes gene_type:complete